MDFGALLRGAFHTVRMAKEVDAMRLKMSYWTDNGAYYEDDYWAKFFTAGNNTPQKVLSGLKAYHASEGLHFGTYQLDPWWSDGNGNIAPNWYWAANWTAAPGYFPDGLASLGMPLTLYSNLYATPALNQMTQFSWLASTVCQEKCYSRVLPNASYAFHSYIFDLGLGWGQNSFEIDFLNYMALSFSDTLTDVRAWDEYWDGMNRAAVEHGFSVQMCMDLPSLAMGSVQWPAVTNARLQGDGFPTDDGRYDIFQSSLLYAALEIAPFLDNIWSTACQPGADNPFNGDCEPYVEALMAISVLSAGPVGLGDAIGMTNVTLAMSAVRDGDGVLLQPSLPATPIDAYYCGLLPPGSRVAAAPSFIPTSASPAPPSSSYPYPYPYPPPSTATYFTSILALDLGEGFSLRLSDTTPPLPPTQDYLVTRLSPGFDALSATCRDGTHVLASGCAQTFNASTPLALLTPPPMGRLKPHDVFSVSPVLQGGWVLLGELRKITRVSPTRFASLVPSAADSGGGGGGGVEVGVVGAPGESVDVALVAPSGTIRRVTVALGGGPGGGASASATISCTTLTGEVCTVGAWD